MAGTAEIAAALAGAIGAKPLGGTAGYMTSLVQIQILAEGTIAAALAPVGAGTTDISTVENKYTQSNVQTLASTLADWPTGRAGGRDLECRPNGRSWQPLDVPVHGLADRDALAGKPGEHQLQHRRRLGNGCQRGLHAEERHADLGCGRHVAQDDLHPSDRRHAGKRQYFLVKLSNPVNTEVQEANGVGEILSYTEYSTTTTLSASTLSTPGQANVTLTAVVTNQDPSISPGTGQVTFYDGSTVLGTSTLDSSGTATLNTSFIALGSHTLTAVFGGYQVVGTVYDPAPRPL